MTLDPDTKRQLIEARERIRAQLIADEGTGGNSKGPPDLGGIYAELKDELRQIDGMLGIDPDDDDHEPGDEDPEAEAAAAAAQPDYEPAFVGNTDANILASKVVIDDAASWGLGRIIVMMAVLGIGIAFAYELSR